MNDINKLLEKLKLIEALYSGATCPGEKDAAFNARERIINKINTLKETDPPIEYKFTLGNQYSRKLFVALLRRYDIKPFRYYRQRHTTVMANVSKTFVDETLWPEFLELDAELSRHLLNTTQKIISEAVFGDSSEAETIKELQDGN